MNLSLADLDNNQQQQQQPANPDIQGGDGVKKPDDLAAAAAAAQQQNQQSPGTDPTKTDADDTKGDGTDEGKDDSNVDDDTSIWDEVDTLRGEKLDVTWKDEQGDIPEEERDTPRGILARERALEARAVTQFEQSIMQEDPRGYEYLLHRRAGGTDEEFFARKTITLPDYDRFKESVDLQTSVYTQALKNTGLPDKQIKQLVDAAVKDKEIFDLADAAYKRTQQEEERSIADLNKQLEEDRKTYDRSVKGLQKALVEEVSSANMGVIVPEAKRNEFLQFVYQHVQYDQQSGAFVIAQVIDPKKLPRQLEAMWLQFNGGKLDDLVRRTAQTDNVRRLRKTIDKSRQQHSTQSDNRPGKKTLSEL